MLTPVHDDLIDALAAYRLTRLATQDTLPAAVAFRNWVRKDWPAWGSELIDCPWCFGFWVSVATAVVRRLFPRTWRMVSRPLAISAAVGLIATAANLGLRRLEE